MKRRREARARVVSRYDRAAKIQKSRTKDGEEEHIPVHERGKGTRWLMPVPSQEQLAAQPTEPVEITPIAWLYHDYWVMMEDPHTYRPDEVVLLVKRAVLREEREMARARQEVETLERFGDLPLATRECDLRRSSHVRLATGRGRLRSLWGSRAPRVRPYHPGGRWRQQHGTERPTPL